MGAIAEAIVEYARPLIDATDGSIEQLNRAMSISQVCWNMAILPENGRQSLLNSLGESLSMDGAELEAFERWILLPMIRRHEEMFPHLHQRESIPPPHWEPRLSPAPAANSPKDRIREPRRTIRARAAVGENTSSAAVLAIDAGGRER